MAKIGELNKRVKIKKKEIKKNDIGKESEVWIIKFELWAKVTSLYGKEYYLAKQVNLEKSIKITLRYTKKIKEDMRIEFQNEDYEIESIENIKFENRWIEIKAIKKER